jgi:hypothetical protein
MFRGRRGTGLAEVPEKLLVWLLRGTFILRRNRNLRFSPFLCPARVRNSSCAGGHDVCVLRRALHYKKQKRRHDGTRTERSDCAVSQFTLYAGINPRRLMPVRDFGNVPGFHRSIATYQDVV